MATSNQTLQQAMADYPEPSWLWLLMDYRELVLEALSSPGLPAYINHHVLHDKAVSISKGRENATALAPYIMMRHLFLNFDLLIGGKEYVDVKATLLFVVLAEEGAYVSRSALLKMCKKKFPTVFDTTTLEAIGQFVKMYEGFLLHKEENIASKSAIIGTRLKAIVKSQPGILISCLSHVYAETYGEPLNLERLFYRDPQTSRETYTFMSGPARLCGFLIQFDLIVVRTLELCVFKSMAEIEKYLLRRARHFSATVATQDSTKDHPITILIDHIFKQKAYLLVSRTRGMAEASRALPDISYAAQAIKAELTNEIRNGTLGRIHGSLMIDLISNSETGYCIESISHLAAWIHVSWRQQLQLSEIFVLEGPTHRLVIPKGRLSRCLKDFQSRAKQILAGHKHGFPMSDFIQNYVQILNDPLPLYSIWPMVSAGLRRVRKHDSNKVYLVSECESPDDILSVSNSSSVTEFLITESPLDQNLVIDHLKLRKIEKPFVLKTELSLSEAVSHVESVVMKNTRPSKKFPKKLASILRQLEITDQQMLDRFMQFRRQIDNAVCKLIEAEIQLQDLLKVGYQGPIATTLEKVMSLMYIRMGRLCLTQKKSSSGTLSTYVDGVASRMLDVAESRCPFPTTEHILIPSARNVSDGTLIRFKWDVCLEALRRYPDRFLLNETEQWFEAKFPLIPQNLMEKYLRSYGTPGVAGECIAHLCQEEYACNLVDMVNFYNDVKIQGIDLPDVDYHAITNLTVLCFGSAHFSKRFDLTPNETSGHVLQFHDRTRSAKVETPLQLLDNFLKWRTQGHQECFIAQGNDVSDADLKCAFGACFNERTSMCDLRLLNVGTVLEYIVKQYPQGVCLTRFRGLSVMAQLVELFKSGRDLAYCQKMLTDKVGDCRLELRRSPCGLSICKTAFINDAVSSSEGIVMSSLNSGTFCLEELCETVKDHRPVLPYRWLADLLPKLAAHGVRFLLGNDDKLYVSTGQSIDSPSGLCELTGIDKGETVLRDADRTLDDPKLATLLKIYPDGLHIKKLKKTYKKEFEAQLSPPSKVTLQDYLMKIESIEIVFSMQRMIVRSKTFDVSEMDREEFESRVKGLLELDKPIGYELLCKKYLKKFSREIPCSRQYGCNNMHEMFHESNDVHVGYNENRRRLLIQLKQPAHRAQEDSALGDRTQLSSTQERNTSVHPNGYVDQHRPSTSATDPLQSADASPVSLQPEMRPVDEYVVLERIHDLLIEMGRLQFPDELIREYNQRYEPPMSSSEAWPLFPSLLKNRELIINSDGLGGVYMSPAEDSDRPVVDDAQEIYEESPAEVISERTVSQHLAQDQPSVLSQTLRQLSPSLHKTLMDFGVEVDSLEADISKHLRTFHAVDEFIDRL